MVLCSVCRENEATVIDSCDSTLLCYDCMTQYMMNHKDMTHVAIPYQLPGSHAPNFDVARELMNSTEKLHRHIREEQDKQVQIKQYRSELPTRIAALKEYFSQKLDQIQAECEGQAEEVQQQIDTNVSCLLKANPKNYEACTLSNDLEFDLSKSFDNGLESICQEVKEAFQLNYATTQCAPVNFTWDESHTAEGIEVEDQGKSIRLNKRGWSSAMINCPLETGNYNWKFKVDGFTDNGDVYLGVARRDVDLNICPTDKMSTWIYNTNIAQCRGKDLGNKDYGLRVEAGDIISVSCSHKNDKLQVSFSQNDQDLGIAFDAVPTDVYPFLSFATEGTRVTILEE